MRKILSLVVAVAVVGVFSALAAEKKASAECEKASCSEELKTTSATFKIKGAACEASCANVDKKLTSIEGLKASTCSSSKKTVVNYDAKKMSSKQLLAAIKKSGLEVESQFVKLDVDGMACGACSSKVSKTLTSVKGVQKNDVCHKSKSATIAFDPNKVSEKDIVATINKSGFKVKEEKVQAN